MEIKTEPHKRFFCSFSDCSAAYNKQWKLDAHVCKHTGIRPHACQHEGCGKSFARSYHLARHELCHTGEKPVRCSVEVCTEAFATNSSRDPDLDRARGAQAKTYACSFQGCGLEFKKNKQLKAHVSEQHAQQPAYHCTHDGCNKRFQLPSKLRRHEKVHRGYPCVEDGCCFTGQTWTDLLKHRTETHRAALSCEHCDKVFRDSWFLQQHKRVHSDTRMVYQCPREGCGRSYTTVFNLQSHVASFHESLRPFVCAHAGCGKTFAMKQSLQRHAVVHDPERRKPQRSRPKRSIASRLSGHSEAKRAERGTPGEEVGLPGPVVLASLMQDTSLLCGSTVYAQEVTSILDAPLSL